MHFFSTRIITILKIGLQSALRNVTRVITKKKYFEKKVSEEAHTRSDRLYLCRDCMKRSERFATVFGLWIFKIFLKTDFYFSIENRFHEPVVPNTFYFG